MAAPETVEGDKCAYKATVLFHATGKLSSPHLDEVAQQRRNVHLSKSSAHGVVSRVYRLPGGGQCSGVATIVQDELCLKRVVEEDQVAPHSVHREIAAYRVIHDAQGNEEAQHTMQLYAAFQDESDPFSVTIDLIMPWVPCTLQELLNEPATLVNLDESSQSPKTDSDAPDSRPAAIVLNCVKRTGPARFALQTCIGIFSALAFLHDKCGIAHRDVKPSNIVLDAKQGCAARLIDFGTCHFLRLEGRARDPRGDDGRGGLASEVGSGAYRAPECLLSPRNGYDTCAVDVWQAAATLVEFFTPLVKVEVAKPAQARPQRDPAEDEDAGIDINALRSIVGTESARGGPLKWETALWADDDGEAWARLQQQDIHEHAPLEFLHDEADFDDREADHSNDAGRIGGLRASVHEQTASGWKRTTLFDGARSDLGLASSIFALRGLPEADNSDGRGGSALWPEASDMQPPLAKLPFKSQPPDPAGLRGRLEELQCEAGLCSEAVPGEDNKLAHKIVEILDACLQLSASKRITAAQALEKLDALVPE